LLLTVDTLRADHLGAYGSDRGLTPRIDALAEDGVLFDAVYAPASHTLPSVAALLTGRYPEEIGVWDNTARLPESVSTLATVFREAGWRTAAVVSNWVLRSEVGLDRDFDLYDDTFPQVEAVRPLPERIASATTDAALTALDGCLPAPAERCLLWVHYQDPHGPYTPPGDLRAEQIERERQAPDGRLRLEALPGPFGTHGIPSYQYLAGQHEVAYYRAGYAGEVAYLDGEVGRLLDALRERGLWERSVLVFTADHGESLGEDDYWFGHGERLHDALVRVPLLLRVPGRAPARRGDVASLVDLHPTLSRLLLGADVPADAPGRDLLAPGAEAEQTTAYLAALGGSKVPRFGLVEGEFKYVVAYRDGVWDGRLVRREGDPVDLTAAAPQVASRFRQRLEQLFEAYRVHQTGPRRDPGDAEREWLEALGYLEPREAAQEAPAPQ
jgi:arylsulfatase